MPERIEFFYDYSSPFSWLADQRLPAIAARHGAEISYRPALLGALVIESGNTPPPSVPAKAAYYGTDIARWVRRLGLAHAPNPHFPLNSVRVMRGALVAQDRDEFERYHPAMWQAMWEQSLHLGEADVVADVLDAAGLDAEAYAAASADPALKARLKANNDEALARGAFGLPSFFVAGELFFGNDRVDFIADLLEQGQSQG